MVVKAHIKPRILLYGVLLIIFVLGVIVSLQSRQINADTVATGGATSLFDKYGFTARPAAVSLCSPGDNSCKPYREDETYNIGDDLVYNDSLVHMLIDKLGDCVAGRQDSGSWGIDCHVAPSEVDGQQKLATDLLVDPGKYDVTFKRVPEDPLADGPNIKNDGQSKVDVSGVLFAEVLITEEKVKPQPGGPLYIIDYNRGDIFVEGGYSGFIRQVFKGENNLSWNLSKTYPELVIDPKSSHTIEFSADINVWVDIKYKSYLSVSVDGSYTVPHYEGTVRFCSEECTFWNKTQANISAVPKDTVLNESYETNLSHEERYVGTGVSNDEDGLYWSRGDLKVDKEDRRSWNMQYAGTNYIGSTSTDAHIEPFNDVNLYRSSFIQTLNYSSPTFHPGEESIINLWTHRVVENDNGVTTVSGEGRIDDPLGATTGVFNNEGGFDKMQVTGSTVPNYQLTQSAFYDISKDWQVSSAIEQFSAPLGVYAFDSSIIPDYFTALTGDGNKTILSSPLFEALPSNLVILVNYNDEDTANRQNELNALREVSEELRVKLGIEVVWRDNKTASDFTSALSNAKDGSLVVSVGHGVPGRLVVGEEDTVTYREIKKILENKGVKLAMFATGSCYSSGVNVLSSVSEQLLGSVSFSYSVGGGESEGFGVSNLFGMGANNFHNTSDDVINILKGIIDDHQSPSECSIEDRPDQPSDPDSSDDVVPDLTPPDLIPPIDLTSDTPDEPSEPTDPASPTDETPVVTEPTPPTEETPAPPGILDTIGDILESIGETIGNLVNPDPTEVEVYQAPTSEPTPEPVVEEVVEVTPPTVVTPAPALTLIAYTPPVIERVVTAVAQAIAYVRNDPTPPQSSDSVTQTSPSTTDAQAVIQNIEEPVRDPADIKTLTWIDKVAVAQNTLGDANHQINLAKAVQPVDKKLVRQLTYQARIAQRNFTLTQRKLKLVQSLSVRYKAAVVRVDTTASLLEQAQTNLSQSNTRRTKYLLRVANARHRIAIRSLLYVQRLLNRY